MAGDNFSVPSNLGTACVTDQTLHNDVCQQHTPIVLRPTVCNTNKRHQISGMDTVRILRVNYLWLVVQRNTQATVARLGEALVLYVPVMTPRGIDGA